MTLLSEIYDVTLKRDIRSAAKGGFVRPTIGEHLMTHRDFEKCVKTTTYLQKHYSLGNISEDKTTFTYVGGGWSYATIPTSRASGKWYIEYKPFGAWATFCGVCNPNNFISEGLESQPGAITAVGNHGSTFMGAFSVMPNDVPQNRYYTVTPKAWEINDYIQVCWDFSTRTLTYYINGVFGRSFTHQLLGASFLSEITFFIMGYILNCGCEVTKSSSYVKYTIPGYEYITV